MPFDLIDLTVWRLLLAQTESSSVTDFFGQITGLVGLTCGAGLIWIVLTAFVLQRAGERRRRAAQGLEPLPSMYTSLWRTLRGERSEDRSAALRLDADPFAPAPPAPVPAPDLALLTGDVSLQPAAPNPVSMQEDAPDELSPPIEPEKTTMAEYVPDPAVGAALDADEVLRVWRDRATGALIVEIDGQRVPAADAARDPGLKARLSDVVQDLYALLAPSQTPLASAEPLPGERTAPRSASTLRQIGRVALGQPAADAPETGSRSIADQIEDLLQSRLQRDQGFRGRAIHVRPSLQGGVHIVVDDRRYEGIGEIDDPDVRALLEDVVREWEATQ